jgi:RNA polymerase primary sigma factor
VIVGFIDPNAPDEIAAPVNPKLAEAAKELEDESEEDEAATTEEEEAVDTGPDPEEAARRFESIGKLFAQVQKGMSEKGADDAKVQKQRKKLSEEFMELKLSPTAKRFRLAR